MTRASGHRSFLDFGRLPMRRIRGLYTAWMILALCAPMAVAPRASAESDTAKTSTQRAVHSPGTSKRLPGYRSARALVQDLRVSQEKATFRLVLDLTHKVRIVQSREKYSGRLLLDLTHTSLSKAAAEKFVGATLLPQAVHVTLMQQKDSLRVALNSGAVTQYHYFLLERPNRFVLDFIPTQTALVSTDQVAGSETTLPPDAAASSRPPAAFSANEASGASASLAPLAPTATVAPRRAGDQIKVIVIDPGHGGKDAGTVSRRGLSEKDITLRVSLRLRDLLKQRLGKRVLMTRERDEFIELGERAKFANSHDADLFVSIHVNSHPQSSVKGIEIYHFGEAKDQRALEVAARENGTPIGNNGVGWEYLVADLLATKRIEDSLELAWQTKSAMFKRLHGTYPTDDHGVKTAPFYVLRYTSMPSILAEIAFMSNPSEEALMRQSTFINSMAEALFNGIKDYIDPAVPASTETR